MGVPKGIGRNSTAKVKEIHADHRKEDSSGRVVSSVIVTGWGRSDIDTSTTSKAVSRAVAEAIGEPVAALNVKVLKVEPAKIVSDSATPLKFDFEVVPTSQVDASKTLLDKVEAKLILLGMVGSQAAQLFDNTLLSELNALEPHVLLHSSFGAVWQQPWEFFSGVQNSARST